MALGALKGGVLSDFQHKIHYGKEGEDIFVDGEFFCDPDDIIFLPTRQEVAYLSYLPWRKDIFVDNDRQFGRLSYLYQPKDLTKLNLIGVPPLVTPLDIRMDKSLSAAHPFLDARVYITNKHSDPVDVVYITQDAAYMFLPDGHQGKVSPAVHVENSSHAGDFFYGQLSRGDVVATYHRDKGFAAGYVPLDFEEVFGGVVPEYAFFVRHSASGVLALPFADVTKKKFANVQALNRHLAEISAIKPRPEQLKNRILVFSFNAVQPGQTVVAHFYQVGAETLERMYYQLSRGALAH
jgi:hypothetical protein